MARAVRRRQPVALSGRPLGPRWAERGRAQVFLGRCADDVAWHRRQALAPRRFAADAKAAGEARRAAVVAPAPRSPRAPRTTRTPRTHDGLPVQSFQTLLHDGATVTQKRLRFDPSRTATTRFTTPTPLPQRALDL